ncbi:hypothetical protein H4R35_000032 [Dimargaris xerosporica]|nr:hypothetical protein H4R35_000032 [Dimargaris xerosporica]
MATAHPLDLHLTADGLPPAGDNAQWTAFWAQCNAEQLVQTLSDRLNFDQCDEDSPALARQIFQGSQLAECSTVHSALFLSLLNRLLATHKLSRRQEAYAQELTDMLNNEIAHCTHLTVLEMNIVLLERIKSFHPFNRFALELFPNMLLRLASLEDLPDHDYPDFANLHAGPDAQDYVLDRLFTYPWHPDLCLSLVTMGRELILTKPQLDFFLHKVFKVLRTVAIDEIPPFVYQILLLSKAGRKRDILAQVIDYFDDLLTQTSTSSSNAPDRIQIIPKDRLHRTENVVLLHLSFAVKQDQELGTELVRLAKARTTPALSPFLVSALLTMAKIHRFESAVIDMLRVKLVHHYKDQHRQRTIMGPSFTGPAGPLDPLGTLFTRLASNNTVGWDQTVPSLLQIALALLEATSNGSSTHPFAKPKESPPISQAMAQAVLATTRPELVADLEPMADPFGSLAVDTLVAIFAAHRMLRAELLDQVLSRIELRAPSSSCCLALLSRLVTNFADVLVADHLTRIKELFNCLAYLTADVAERVMLTVLPLVRQDGGFCDHLMLVLRKHMFSRAVEGRQVALTGLLVLLASVTTELVSTTDAALELALAYELIGMLHRCLTQQHAIRLRLYQGLVALVGELTLPVSVTRQLFTMLQSHLTKYLATPLTSVPPVMLDRALASNTDGQSAVLEPLPWLIKAVLAVHRTFVVANAGLASDEFTTQLSDIMTGWLSADLTDFGLDTAADFSATTNVGVQKGLLLTMVLQIHEVMLEHVLLRVDTPAGTMARELFAKEAAVYGLIRSKVGPAKGRRTAPVELVGDLMSLSTVVQALAAGTTSPEPWTAPFHNHAPCLWLTMTMGLAQVHRWADHPECLPSPLAMVQVTRLATNLVQHFLLPWIHQPGRLASDIGLNNRDQTRGYVGLVADLFANSFALMIRSGRSALEPLLTAMAALPDFGTLDSSAPTQPQEALLTPDQTLSLMAQMLQKLLVAFVSETTPIYHEGLPLLRVLELLTVPRSGSQLAPLGPTVPVARQLTSWLRRLCTEVPVEDLTVVRTLLQLVVTLENQQTHDSTTLQFLAQDVHTLLGDVVEYGDDDNDNNALQTLKFAVVTPRTAPAVIGFVLGTITKWLDDVEWMVNQLKDQINAHKAAAKMHLSDTADAMVGDHPNLPCPSYDALVTILYPKLTTCIKTLTTLEQTCLPSAVPAQLLQVLQKTFKVLSQLVRVQTLSGGTIRKPFTELIQLVGQGLTRQLDVFIPQFQAKDSEELTFAAQRKKRQKKGKASSATGSLPAKYRTKLEKESRFIPQLVYHREQFEQYIIQLTKKSKVNMTQYLRRSTAHDFQIVQHHLEDLTTDDEEAASSLKAAALNEAENELALGSSSEGAEVDLDNTSSSAATVKTSRKRPRA